MKKVFRSKEEKDLLRHRGIIETLFDHLKNSLMLWHRKHKYIMRSDKKTAMV